MPQRKPASPGLLAAQAARRVAVAALYWGPVIFLLATAVLVVGLWKGANLGGLMYLDPRGDWREQTANLTDLLWRGMSA